MRLIGRPGQENDSVQAKNLIHGRASAHVLADKVYDADTVLAPATNSWGKTEKNRETTIEHSTKNVTLLSDFSIKLSISKMLPAL